MTLDFLSSHPLLAAFAVTLSFEGALAFLIYSLSPACGRHCTALVAWWTRTFTDPIREDAKFVPPLRVVHREIDEPTFEARDNVVLFLPTLTDVMNAQTRCRWEREAAGVTPFRRTRRVN